MIHDRPIQAEHKAQLESYFLLLACPALPSCRRLAQEILELSADEPLPRIAFPMPNIPSSLHSSIVQAMGSAFQTIDPDAFEIANEYLGLAGPIFAVDCAVFYRDKLAAFVEVDGYCHYTPQEAQIRRKDLLKEFLYKVQHPEVPMYRLRAAQIYAIGESKSGNALAQWIANDIFAKVSSSAPDICNSSDSVSNNSSNNSSDSKRSSDSNSSSSSRSS